MRPFCGCPRTPPASPQVVPTNFDLLFEKAAGQELTTHVGPALSDFASGQAFNGLVYLHDRMNLETAPGKGRQGLVVSSSDFGRAYLAEGWATRFVRDLLNQYIGVLLGYSANDPSVRYLLQGLNARKNGSRARLFAFDSGSREEVGQRWRDTEVQAIAYQRTDDEHSLLWDTLGLGGAGGRPFGVEATGCWSCTEGDEKPRSPRARSSGVSHQNGRRR